MIDVLFAGAVSAALSPPADPDTRAWWATTAALSSDAMDGRDTGSADYDRAARLVADRFARAGLKPAGDKGGMVPAREDGEVAGDRRAVLGRRPAAAVSARNHVRPVGSNPARRRRGAGLSRLLRRRALGDVRGKLVICHGTHRAGLPGDAARVAAESGGRGRHRHHRRSRFRGRAAALALCLCARGPAGDGARGRDPCSG